jgi:hypothetical protein
MALDIGWLRMSALGPRALIGGDMRNVLEGSEVAGRTVGWDVSITRLRAQKQTDSHRPLSDLVLRAV